MSEFQINDKVVCVKDNLGESFLNDEVEHPCGHVQKGEIYVVSGLRIGQHDTGEHLSLLIVGKPSITKRNFVGIKAGEDGGWDHERFRKLTDIQQENSLKRKHKKPYGQQIPV